MPALPPRIDTPAALSCLYAATLVAGTALAQTRVPLPWMIGPMAMCIAISMSGTRVEVPAITRPIGQLVVGITVGAFLTPAALEAIGQQFGAMLIAVAVTMVGGLLAALLLMRLARLDGISANLASIPCGPVEMAALAERYGVDAGPIVFSQILRIVLLVLLVPPVLALAGGSAVMPPAPEHLGAIGTVLVLLVGLIGGFLFRLIRVTSPFFLGPLCSIALLTAAGAPIHVLPNWIVAGSQVLLGVWLGCTFDRALVTKAGRVVLATFVSTGLLLSICAAMALIFSQFAGIRWKTMILATAPGSVTEMALTAQVLGEGVALVTAFHVTRIAITLPLVPVIFRLVDWIAARRRSARKPGADS